MNNPPPDSYGDAISAINMRYIEESAQQDEFRGEMREFRGEMREFQKVICTVLLVFCAVLLVVCAVLAPVAVAFYDMKRLAILIPKLGFHTQLRPIDVEEKPSTTTNNSYPHYREQTLTLGNSTGYDLSWMLMILLLVPTTTLILWRTRKIWMGPLTFKRSKRRKKAR